jgi:nitrogen fixation protein NifX
MRIAFASNDGKNINEHFGSTKQFFFFDVGPDFATPYGKAVVGWAKDDHEHKLMSRVNAVDGSTLMYCAQIGGPAAAKLVARHIHPLKARPEQTIESAISELQQALSKPRLPPWLRIAAGLKAPELPALEETLDV